MNRQLLILERGSPEAVGAVTSVYREHALGLIRLGMLMVGDQATAEDVVHDAFLELHRRWPSINDPVTYTRSAVLNRCRSVLRRRAVARRFGMGQPPPAWSAESAVMVDEERRTLLEAIARLPRRQREVLYLRFYADLPEAEIARTLGVSRGTVSSTTSRALAALGKTLGDQS
ncbi:RNA polymerase sigma factor [Actinoallomurus sp. CA-150999]|uniref:RNA polymerase sigma factor n=1 Tax=Actinoallomurus sp. CA-150999 TaxID=3239887 RepID=UPI003D8EFE59